MTDNPTYVLAVLLPLVTGLLVVQSNPYRALVIRGILGSVAALVYALLGAADVAVTEALVGTLLAVLLYAVAVRSSLVLRLGVLSDDLSLRERDFDILMADIRGALAPYHVQVEWVTYQQLPELQQAMARQDVHAICTCPEPAAVHTTTQVYHLYEILQKAWSNPQAVQYQPVVSGAKD